MTEYAHDGYPAYAPDALPVRSDSDPRQSDPVIPLTGLARARSVRGKVTSPNATDGRAPRMSAGRVQALRRRARQVARPVATSPVIRRVRFDGIDVKGADASADHNAQIILDGLNALIEAQNQDVTDSDTWISWVSEINNQLVAGGVNPAVLAEINKFYEEVEELNFRSNPVLREVWNRCLASTKADVDKKDYTKVGGKFKDHALKLLEEVKKDFPQGKFAQLRDACDKFAEHVPGLNKEHAVNKGGTHGGPQTEHYNLMSAATPDAGDPSSLSPFHKQLHAMKPGTGTVNYGGLNPDIRKIIETAQAKYSDKTMGVFKK